MNKEPLNERELPDDYPIYPGYLYVIDGEVIQSTVDKTTVGELKKIFAKRRPIKSITNCDINGRNLWHLAV